jgi:deazaflavin-dependent oxidoreductase (nitroreductase family)
VVAGGSGSGVAAALAAGGIADITTIGRKTGLPRRKEIYFHNFDGALYIGGRPGFPRDWVANLRANPEFTLHLRRGVVADLPARAEVVKDPVRRREVLYRMVTESWNMPAEKADADIDRWVKTSPLVRFELV